MATETQEVLIKIQVEADQAVKRQQELKTALDGAKIALKELETAEGKTSAAYIAQEATVKQLNTQIAANQRVLTQMASTTTEAAGAYAALNQKSAEANQRAKDLAAAYGASDQRTKEAQATALGYTNQLKEIDKAIGQNQRSVGDYGIATQGLAGAFADMPGALGKMGGAVSTATTGFQAMNAASPVGWIQIAIQIIAGLVQKFSSFAPVADAITNGLEKLSAAFDVLKNGVIAVITGQKSLGEVLSGSTDEMKKQIKEAERLAEAQRDLEDRTEASTISQEKYKNQINQMLLQSKNRTLSEKERMKLIDDALALENKAYNERKKLVDDEVKLLQDKLIKQGGLNAFEASELRKKGVSYARYKENQKNLDDQTIKDLAAALVKQQQAEGESISLREKTMNRRDQLADKEAEAAEKREEKAQAAREKREAAREKLEAKRKADKEKAEKEELDRLKKGADDAIKVLEYEMQMYKLKDDEKNAGVKLSDKQAHAQKLADIDAQNAVELEKQTVLFGMKQITEQQFNDAVKLANQEKNTAIAQENAAFEASEAAKKTEAAEALKQTTRENLLNQWEDEKAILELKGQDTMAVEKKILDDKMAQELAAVGLTEDQKLAIKTKYSLLEDDLEKKKKAAQLNSLSQLAGNIAGAFGESTKVGKAAASAQIAIDTYKGAMAAFASMQGIPFVGPALGVAAAAAVAAQGAKSIKDVWAVKSGLPGDEGGGGTTSVNASVTAATNVTGSLVSRTSSETNQQSQQTAVSNALQDNPVQPVLVVDNVTDAQTNKANVKVANSL